MENNYRDVYIFITGFSIGIFALALIAALNTTKCVRCGNDCTDSAVYCSECGQQLRIVEEFKKK
jgi:predicted amidophosphoribosyltransferase